MKKLKTETFELETWLLDVQKRFTRAWMQFYHSKKALIRINVEQICFVHRSPISTISYEAFYFRGQPKNSTNSKVEKLKCKTSLEPY